MLSAGRIIQCANPARIGPMAQKTALGAGEDWRTSRAVRQHSIQNIKVITDNVFKNNIVPTAMHTRCVYCLCRLPHRADCTSISHQSQIRVIVYTREAGPADLEPSRVHCSASFFSCSNSTHRARINKRSLALKSTWLTMLRSILWFLNRPDWPGRC